MVCTETLLEMDDPLPEQDDAAFVSRTESIRCLVCTLWTRQPAVGPPVPESAAQ